MSQYSHGRTLIVTPAVIETSFMLKRGVKVKKNWQNAAHFHWVLSTARFSEAEGEDWREIVGCMPEEEAEGRGILDCGLAGRGAAYTYIT